MTRAFFDVKWLCVSLLVASSYVHIANSKPLLKLAAAAAIIRGGPIIPIPVRYPVHVPHPKVLKVPVHHPVPVKVPVHHHTHSVKKIPIPVHHHTQSYEHHGHVEVADEGHGWQHGWHDSGFEDGHIGGGGLDFGHSDIGHISHGW
ncbi:hypothetical protein BIW11_00326 [Tropilaelaps mercedesae]|uniref:Uncharacterized protein n=1 Tax=Tropilaelaps mercedesae TaxID=418985 RepID=A0A1V9XXT3_9ACAR|nr:hypothetical protein BIW11_00326 [Tropilaelaps mercedesae]